MSFTAQLLSLLFLIVSVAVLARRSSLSLGLRSPNLRSGRVWISSFFLWCMVEWLVITLTGVQNWVNTDVIYDKEDSYSLESTIIITGLLVPLFEEMVFRGVMFSFLASRYNIFITIGFPSILWAIAHVNYSWLIMISIAGSGVILGAIRWKTNSLYVPIALHSLYNISVTLIFPMFIA